MKQGWEIKKLGEVCLVISGQSPESKHYNTQGNGMPFYQGKKEFTDRYMGNPTTWTTDITKIAKPLDILMSVRAPVGDVNYTTEEICIGRGLAAIRVGKSLNNDYLFYYLLSIQDKINGKEGAVFPSINRKDIESLNIPICHFSEQERIVGILDSAFAKIEALRANAQQNLQNTKDLFQASIEAEFNNNRWERERLSVIAKISYGYTEKSSFEEIGPKFLRITDIQDNYVDWDNVPYCKCSDADLLKFRLEMGDIVFARTGATTGKSYLIENTPIAVFASYLIRLKMNSVNEFAPKFIFYFFQTKIYWEKINAGISGSAQGGFNATKLGELELSFPKSVFEQQAIVKKLDALSERSRVMEENYRQTLTAYNDLKQALLKKAFNGEL